MRIILKVILLIQVLITDVDDILDKLTSSKETPGCDSGNPIESKSTKSNVGAGQSIPHFTWCILLHQKLMKLKKAMFLKILNNNNYLISYYCSYYSYICIA